MTENILPPGTQKTRAERYGGAEKEDAKIVTLAVVKAPPMRSSSDLTREYLERLQARADGVLQHVDTGFSSIDATWPGLLHDGNLIVLAARPGMGKTALALQLAEQVAQAGRTAIFITLEMSPIDLIERSIARRAGCTISTLRMASPGCDYDRISSAAEDLMSLPLLIDGGPLSIDELVLRIRQNISELESRSLPPLGLIVVDYLQLLAGIGQNRTLEIDYVSRNLKILAAQVNVPIIALAQLNRAVESRTDKRPNASDLRESGSIEQDADSILMIYRDEAYNLNSTDVGTAELICVKNRHGNQGMVRMAFNGERMMFGNLLVELGGGVNSSCVRVSSNGRRDNVQY